VILRQAFAILNEAGLESLTLRRLASRLEVQAPAIYWHFKNKQDLLEEMAAQVFREAIAEAPAADSPGHELPWQDWAEAYGEGLRRVLLRYREGAKIFSGTYLTDASIYAQLEASLRRLTNAGFSLRDAVTGMGALYSFTVGFVIEEQAVRPMPEMADPRYDLAVREARIDRERYPLAFAAGAEIFGENDARFRSGTALIVAGMATLLPNGAKV
jgi:AcrR family transcriptional regulator